MTDMRATGRLLETIGERALALYSNAETDSFEARQADEIMNAIAELRRRGDTLVRHEDLRQAVETAHDGAIVGRDDYARWGAAIGRLEIALGGEPR